MGLIESEAEKLARLKAESGSISSPKPSTAGIGRRFASLNKFSAQTEKLRAKKLSEQGSVEQSNKELNVPRTSTAAPPVVDRTPGMYAASTESSQEPHGIFNPGSVKPGVDDLNQLAEIPSDARGTLHPGYNFESENSADSTGPQAKLQKSKLQAKDDGARTQPRAIEAEETLRVPPVVSSTTGIPKRSISDNLAELGPVVNSTPGIDHVTAKPELKVEQPTENLETQLLSSDTANFTTQRLNEPTTDPVVFSTPGKLSSEADDSVDRSKRSNSDTRGEIDHGYLNDENEAQPPVVSSTTRGMDIAYDQSALESFDAEKHILNQRSFERSTSPSVATIGKASLENSNGLEGNPLQGGRRAIPTLPAEKLEKPVEIFSASSSNNPEDITPAARKTRQSRLHPESGEHDLVSEPALSPQASVENASVEVEATAQTSINDNRAPGSSNRSRNATASMRSQNIQEKAYPVVNDTTEAGAGFESTHQISFFSDERIAKEKAKAFTIDPQNGSFHIPHELFQAIVVNIRRRHDFDVFCCLLRQSLGWQRDYCEAGLSYIAKWTKINDRNNVSKALKRLLANGFIEILQNPDYRANRGTIYKIPLATNYLKNKRAPTLNLSANNTTGGTSEPPVVSETTDGSDNQGFSRPPTGGLVDHPRVVSKTTNKEHLKEPKKELSIPDGELTRYLNSILTKTQRESERGELLSMIGQGITPETLSKALIHIEKHGIGAKGEKCFLPMKWLNTSGSQILQKFNRPEVIQVREAITAPAEPSLIAEDHLQWSSFLKWKAGLIDSEITECVMTIAQQSRAEAENFLNVVRKDQTKQIFVENILRRYFMRVKSEK